MDIHMRPATIDDCDALGLVIVTASLKTFLGNIPEEDFDFSWTPEVSANNWREFFTDGLSPEQFFMVAEMDQRVVGYVWAGRATGRPDYERAVDGLYVLPSVQCQGVGRALLRYVANRLCDEGVNGLLIGCLKENPSCGFYQHLGGVEIFRQPRNYDRYATEEIFFGWRDLQELL
ncbi:MAG: GNAT family N-acetyltransferase [Caldilineaceae bacterium]